MRPSSLLRIAPKAPFTSKHVDAFGVPKRSPKAWDGQDKDRFFRDKYSHVHAKQLKLRKQEQELSRFRRAARDPPKVSSKLPDPSFASKVSRQADKDHTLEYIYGTGPVTAVLGTRKVKAVHTGHTLADVDPVIRRLAEESKIPLKTGVPMQHLNIMAANGVHNKYVAQVARREYPVVENIEVNAGSYMVDGQPYKLVGNRTHPIGLYVDEVTDTHNLGAILRSAHWLGADFVAISGRNSAPLSPAVIKASAGAAEFTNIYRANHPLKLFEQLKDNGWALVASTVGPQRALTRVNPDDLSTLAHSQPTMLIVGSEGEGLRTSLLQRSTHSVTLPSMHVTPGIDSLNVSVATALLLSHLTKP